MASKSVEATLTYFGTTTFRLEINGLTIFLDTWLERSKAHKKYINIDDVEKADYICISHAHFDHLPGADKLAIRTGARVIGNPETIRILRDAGVPDDQLLCVAGGERVPLFSKEVWSKVSKGEGPAPGPRFSGAPPRPDPALASLAVDIWPSLHCLITPGSHKDEFDLTDQQPKPASEWKSTLDMNYAMRWGLLRLGKILRPEAQQEPGMKAMIEYFEDAENKFSHCDGGQLMYNFRAGGPSHNEKAILWNAHLGCYDGIMKTVRPKPDVAILGAAGEVNLNGRPYTGSAADFLLEECEWLGFPKTVIWCLHDESPIPPYRSNTAGAKELIESKSSCRVLDMDPARGYELF
ncbi:hypothetical protein CKM354_001015400 [Cercospora kikuchii]|uniref:Metallo-beta-lactamase domain-containing protein n=1 Tax=Cercospora kikuchii TaxID=84275 RepID=A0A9P3CYN3_9PEZI|nr:uncharacterized protein CKM354_001015400 [Cercospora kikuchii]GIZ47053.1 hypothetical protein CKM354_001015400 [Cercospora kikuchii]